MAKRKAVAATVGVDVYRVIDRAVEEGIARGLYRSQKHVDADKALTSEQHAHLREHLQREIMGSLCDWLRFPDAQQ